MVSSTYTIICSSLAGFIFKGAVGHTGGLFPLMNSLSTYLSEVNCTGIESQLTDCTALRNGTCSTLENAAVICQGTRDHHDYNYISVCAVVHITDEDTEYSNCEDGDVRLMGGSNPLEGRVEVCINRAWGTICDNGFNNEDATVICNQLGVPFESEHELLLR